MHEQLVERARHRAIRLWHNYVGCEHLLLVLADDGALAPYGVTAADVEREVRAQLAGWAADGRTSLSIVRCAREARAQRTADELSGRAGQRRARRTARTCRGRCGT